MDHFSSHEERRVEVRQPMTAPKPRSSQLRPPATGSRLRRMADRRGLQSHDPIQAQHTMDAAIQRDLQGQGNDLSARIAALLADNEGEARLHELGDLLARDVRTQEVVNFVHELDAQDLPPEDVLEALADFAASHDAVPAVAPWIAAISVQQLAPFPEESSVDHLTQLVDSLQDASTQLAQVHGPEAMAAMPRILGVIQHHARLNRLPVSALPSAIRRITEQVSANGEVVERLLHRPKARQVVDPTAQRGSTPAAPGGSMPPLQRLVIDRPVELTIRYLD